MPGFRKRVIFLYRVTIDIKKKHNFYQFYVKKKYFLIKMNRLNGVYWTRRGRKKLKRTTNMPVDKRTCQNTRIDIKNIRRNCTRIEHTRVAYQKIYRLVSTKRTLRLIKHPKLDRPVVRWESRKLKTLWKSSTIKCSPNRSNIPEHIATWAKYRAMARWISLVCETLKLSRPNTSLA